MDPNQPFGIYYCNQSIYIAPGFTMTATSPVTAMKISFSVGYKNGEDFLDLVGYNGPVQKIWSASQGFLTLYGGSGVNDLVEAIRMVQYINLSGSPTMGERAITFTLDDGDYLPETQHFYRFVSSPGISWSSAMSQAASSKYFGMQGYLATITSSGENSFIQQKTKGVGWIGASDAYTEGDWRWVTGPEGNENGGQGRLFWRGTGTQAYGNPNLGPVNGAYHNWNRFGSATNAEPNQSGDEDYAHITFFSNNPGESLKWNDLPNAGGNGQYVPAGYLVEFGGTPNDPPISMIAIISLQVSALTFSSVKDFTICEGDSVKLNQSDNAATYLWRPATGLSNPNISNPFAKPIVTTQYTLTATYGSCKDSAKFTVNVKTAPVSLLKAVEDICIGKSVTLDPGNHTSYLWGSGETNRTINRSVDGLNRVTLTAPNGCKAKDSVLVVVHQYPKMDLSGLVPLTCGSLTTAVNISSDKGSYVMTNLVNNQQFQGTTVTVPAYGNYLFKAHVTDPYGCPSDTTVMLLFHKIPDVKITIDETECYGYNLQASYVGTSNPVVSRFTWIFGGDTISNKLNQPTEQIPLGINQSKRDLVLKVTEDGCTGSYSQKDILVIPDLKMFVKDSLQCQPVTFDFFATNTENVVKYEWEWGDGTKGTGKTTTHLYNKEGFYDVSLTVTTDKGCTNSATTEKMVYVAPIPTVGFSISPDMCLNQGKDTLYYVGSANVRDTYYWDLKGFDSQEIVQSPDTTAGPFVFELINKPKTNLSLFVISQYGCRSATATLTVKRRPLFSFTSSLLEGCAPVEVEYKGAVDDPVDQLSFDWDFGNGSLAAGAQVTHIYEIPDTRHDLKLRASSSVTGCADSLVKSDYITVHPNPTAGFTMDHEIVYNDAPQVSFFDQSVDAVSYLWNFGDGINSREKDPVHSYAVVGKRKVLQTVYNQFDCQDTTSKRVLIAFSKIFAPNAFAPNASAAIDRVFLLASEGINQEGYHLTIISRWNDKVFECRNEVKGWDGKMSNGNWAPAGNYVWILECIDFLGRPHRQTGLVTLVF